MDVTADRMPQKLIFPQTVLLIVGLCVFTLLAGLLFCPATAFAAEDSPEVEQLKQNAQKAFVKGDYSQAAALDLEIAEKYPNSEARRYAVQMLGTLYEDNIVDLKKAINWNQEFLNNYADPRQIPVYKEKVASLEKLLNQEQAFQSYQSIRFAHQGDEAMVKGFEALLKEHPDFLLRDKVESDLAYAYDRLDQRKKSALAFQAITSEGDKLSTTDKAAYKDEARYWRMRTTWAWAAWALIGALWAAVLLAKPWKQLSATSIKKLLLWPALWLLLTGASMPFFFSMETTGYPIVIPATTIYIAVGLNLIVLFWLLLLIKGEFWQTRPLALRLLAPVLTLLMTTGVFYLWIVYQPNGPYIVDVCVVKYDYWRGELREWALKHRSMGQSARE